MVCIAIHILSACGACVGVCESCVGVWGSVCGAGVGGCVGWCWSRGREKVLLAPLYYPDTLVNSDTCLGSNFDILCTFLFR